MTIRSAAEQLSVSRSMIRKLVSIGALSRVVLGRAVRVRVEEVDALVARGWRTPVDPEETIVEESPVSTD
jgi:excisionase family DNA binding protein